MVASSASTWAGCTTDSLDGEICSDVLLKLGLVMGYGCACVVGANEASGLAGLPTESPPKYIHLRSFSRNEAGPENYKI